MIGRGFRHSDHPAAHNIAMGHGINTTQPVSEKSVKKRRRMNAVMVAVFLG
jgi:hypothetical protein